MTSLPIMWYACFDFEKKRRRRGRYGLNDEMRRINEENKHDQISQLSQSVWKIDSKLDND